MSSVDKELGHNIMNSPLRKLSVLLITAIVAAVFATPAQAVYDIAISRTAFGAGVASNVGVTLSGFDENQSYQATVKFVDTSTNLDATSGTLAATAAGTSLIAGYSSYSGTKLGFKGTYSQVAAALASVTWNPSGAGANLSIRIGLAPYEGDSKFYDANSGHYYQYVSTPASWTNARIAAESTYLYGLRGYLAEINTAAENNFIGSETSATNIWVGATEDATTTANYTSSSYNGSAGQRWIWAGAIETPLPTGTGDIAQSPSAAFSSWAGGEPNNDVKPGADCAVTNWGGRGFWNDLACTDANSYLIEFGGRPGETFTAAAKTFTSTVYAKEAVTLGTLRSNVTCTFGVNCSFPLSLTDPTAKNSSNVDVPGTFAYTSSNTASTTVSASGSGATVSLLGAGSSTITATFTPTNTVLYAGDSKSFTVTVNATAPAAPTGLAATAANGSVALSWTAGSNGGSAITDYLIKYSTDESTWLTFADGTSTATSATVSGLTNGTLYFFRVSATNAVTTSAASTVVSTTPNVPPAPTGLSATPGNGSVRLSWTAGSYGGPAVEDYVVEYSTDESTWSTFDDGTSAATSATVSGLTNGTLYFFRVSATNTLGSSPFSSVASTTPFAPPTPISTPSPNPSPTASRAQPIDIGTAQNPAPLVDRIIEDLIEALRPVIVDLLASPPADAPVLSAQSALNLVTSTENKVLGNSPSLVLFGGQYQPSRVVILDDTIAQVVAPNGGVMNLQAKNGEIPIAVNGIGRVQVVQSNLVVAEGNGLAPNTEFAVYLFSEPTLLGVGKTNQKGEFFVSFAVGKKIPLGDHTLQVNGLLADGRTSSVSMPVSIVDKVDALESEEVPLGASPVAETTDLPYSVFALVGLVLLVLGLWWFLAAIRRRKNEQE